ncbi:helix-turn-helix domain-containing protein [Rothia nasimurium]|uniref:helix-turn-helix domain-containing protein n=1 Tax=Rothia nasimurium TaxID=85336 RepID=UPI003B9EB1BC
MEIIELLREAAEHPTQTARKAGIARSTLLRITQEKTEPTPATLREIALAHGCDLNYSLKPASDPWAITAARYLLDPTLPENLPQERPEIAQWLARYARWGVIPSAPGVAPDPEKLAEEAAPYGNLPQRPGVYFYAPTPLLSPAELALRVASAGDQAGASWALSGAPIASHFLGQKATQGPTVLWVEGDLNPAARNLSLTLTETPIFQPAGVVLVQAETLELEAATQDGGVNLVAPIQGVLDLHSLGFGSLAQDITSHWGEN